jgi:outer membrane protein OmpA-like peptidoglycan-associated protein
MPKESRIGIALQPLTRIKPLRMPNRAKETPRRNRIETERPQRLRISNSSEPQEREVLRARLLQQLNAILATRDTARGLVVNLSDVLFDTGKYTLRPMAREKLAKISGIILVYPYLRLAIEGNTDSVGGDAMNQELSVQRAGAAGLPWQSKTFP